MRCDLGAGGPRSRAREDNTQARTHLVLGLGLEAAEDGVLVGEGIEGRRHGWLPAAKREAADPIPI